VNEAESGKRATRQGNFDARGVGCVVGSEAKLKVGVRFFSRKKN